MRCVGWQKHIVARFERFGLTVYLDVSSPLDQQYPLVLRLNVLGQRDVGRAGNSLNNEIVVMKQRLKTLAGGRWCRVVKQILDVHERLRVCRDNG